MTLSVRKALINKMYYLLLLLLHWSFLLNTLWSLNRRTCVFRIHSVSLLPDVSTQGGAVALVTHPRLEISHYRQSGFSWVSFALKGEIKIILNFWYSTKTILSFSPPPVLGPTEAGDPQVRCPAGSHLCTRTDFSSPATGSDPVLPSVHHRAARLTSACRFAFIVTVQPSGRQPAALYHR